MSSELCDGCGVAVEQSSLSTFPRPLCVECRVKLVTMVSDLSSLIDHLRSNLDELGGQLCGNSKCDEVPREVLIKQSKE